MDDENYRLRKLWELSMLCVECGAHYLDLLPNKNYMLSLARESGWRVGKRPLCPDCNRKRSAA